MTYPDIHDGLIYVGDNQTGLHVLKYTGPHADEVPKNAVYSSNVRVPTLRRQRTEMPRPGWCVVLMLFQGPGALAQGPRSDTGASPRWRFAPGNDAGIVP